MVFVLLVKGILKDLKLFAQEGVWLHCDNKSTIAIAHKSVKRDQTKYIKIDRHFIKEKIDEGIIILVFMGSSKQVADIFIKQMPDL